MDYVIKRDFEYRICGAGDWIELAYDGANELGVYNRAQIRYNAHIFFNREVEYEEG